MADLKLTYADIGLQNVTTYIQSGNVVFDSDKSAEELRQLIETGISEKHSIDTAVIVRSASEWQEIITDSPFASVDDATDESKRRTVTFLSKAPDPELVELAKEVDSGEDEFEVREREIYVSCAESYGLTVLSNGFFEKQLKVLATTRNWRSVKKIGLLL